MCACVLVCVYKCWVCILITFEWIYFVFFFYFLCTYLYWAHYEWRTNWVAKKWQARWRYAGPINMRTYTHTHTINGRIYCITYHFRITISFYLLFLFVFLFLVYTLFTINICMLCCVRFYIYFYFSVECDMMMMDNNHSLEPTK